MVYWGNYSAELNSDFEYRRGSNVKIECVRYDTFKKIMDAVQPILKDEVELIKKELEKRNELE